MRICDTHCDTLYNLVTAPGNANDITMERLKAGGVSLQVMAMYVGPKAPIEETELLFDKMLAAFDGLKAQGWVQAMDPGEAVDGQVKVMLSIEGCEVFERGLETIQRYRGLGVRMAAVTWNHENALATPHCVNATDGLKPYGLQAVKEMQRLKIAVDISPTSTRQACAHPHQDRCAAHGQPQLLPGAQRPYPQPDRRAAQGPVPRGRLCGAQLLPRFPSATAPVPWTLVDHFDHMMAMGGEGKIGFGSDFDGISTKPEGLDNSGGFARAAGRAAPPRLQASSRSEASPAKR